MSNVGKYDFHFSLASSLASHYGSDFQPPLSSIWPVLFGVTLMQFLPHQHQVDPGHSGFRAGYSKDSSLIKSFITLSSLNLMLCHQFNPGGFSHSL